ncbi:MAG: hypothetical protein QXT77_05760 [Candidatus Methanomethylicaceae archaeon]
MEFRESLACLVSASALCIAGCGGGKQVGTYDVWGEVKYRGEAIPAGTVTFQPDSSKGNQGPALSLVIENGRFDSRRTGRGHIGGPHRVRIAGFKAAEKAQEELFAGSEPLFPEWETQVDLPKKDCEQNFEVPANWGFPPMRPTFPRPGI